MHWALRGPVKWTRMFVWCSFSPFYLCLISCDVLQREGRPNRPFCFSFFFTRCRCHRSSSLAQPFPSCWAWIFISSLSDLPFLRTLFRCEVLFMLTTVSFELVLCPTGSRVVTQGVLGQMVCFIRE